MKRKWKRNWCLNCCKLGSCALCPFVQWRELGTGINKNASRESTLARAPPRISAIDIGSCGGDMSCGGGGGGSSCCCWLLSALLVQYLPRISAIDSGGGSGDCFWLLSLCPVELPANSAEACCGELKGLNLLFCFRVPLKLTSWLVPWPSTSL